jgi:galactose mutarotase-like enzyme
MPDQGARGLKEENVLIQAGGCEVTIFPELGGKIASIRVCGLELLQAPLAPYGPRTQTMGFDEGDASGWDECLPSVASCTVETAAGKASVPDHGDLWRQVWKTTAKTANSTAMRVDCFSLPLTVERTATLIETKNGWRLSLLYKITNTGASPAPWSWAAHPLFTAEAGDRIVLPESIHELRIEGSGGNRLGQGGGKVAWPVAALAKGGETDLSAAEEPTTGIGDKLFTGRLTATENFCALERPKAGLRIRFSFDPAMTPYLGLWICYGGWPDRPGPKQVCVAMEPSTAPVDSLAIGGPWSLELAPGESFSWPMIVDIETLQDVNPHA